jgi:putative hydrolase of the HAD superfamily
MMISCVLFDLDNTLTDRAASIGQFAQCFFTDFRSALHEGITLDVVRQVMLISDSGGYRPKETMFAEVQSVLHWRTTPDIPTIADYWYRQSPLCMQVRPGIEATLDALQQRGYRLGIVTNGKTVVQNATLDAIDLRHYFGPVIISEAAGVRKPDPRIFHLALSRLQTRPHNAVFVGDHPQADVDGARNAGLHAVWFAASFDWPADLTPPEHCISEMPQLLPLLDSLTG